MRNYTLILVLVTAILIPSIWLTPSVHAANWASLDAQMEYPTVQPGETFHFWIRVRNSGDTTWKGPGQGYAWQGTGQWSGTLNELWRDVPPGDTLMFEMDVTAPERPGKYTYGFMLMHWGQLFGPHFFIEVTVQANPPRAEFDAWPQEGTGPLTVAFHSNASGAIDECFWDYGDGSTGNSCADYHDHTYTRPGNYTVKFTVRGPGGSSGQSRQGYIRVVEPVQSRSMLLNVNWQWKEPDDPAHVNYCGQGATQVALDAAGLDEWQIPDIETLGREEYVNQGKLGTYVKDIVPIVNSYLERNGRAGLYKLAYISEEGAFRNMLVHTLESNHALITGVKTGRMPGWTLEANHIVAVIGYEQSGGDEYVTYVETAAPSAGYYGEYRNTVSFADFMGYVHGGIGQAYTAP